jgi:hypothetical protein
MTTNEQQKLAKELREHNVSFERSQHSLTVQIRAINDKIEDLYKKVFVVSYGNTGETQYTDFDEAYKKAMETGGQHVVTVPYYATLPDGKLQLDSLQKERTDLECKFSDNKKHSIEHVNNMNNKLLSLCKFEIYKTRHYSRSYDHSRDYTTLLRRYKTLTDVITNLPQDNKRYDDGSIMYTVRLYFGDEACNDPERDVGKDIDETGYGSD